MERVVRGNVSILVLESLERDVVVWWGLGSSSFIDSPL